MTDELTSGLGGPAENLPDIKSSPAPVADTMHGGKAATNAVYLIAAFGLMQAFRFVANIVFARVLAPEAFGIMALVNVLIQGLHMLSDAGVWICVVQSPRGEDPKFLQTAWTVQVCRGFYLWIASCLIAWPAAWFYQEWLLLYFVPLVGATCVISGFNSVSMFLQNRRMALFRLALIEVIAYAIPTCVAIVAVQYYHTVWVLVFAAIGTSIVQLILSHVMLPSVVHRFSWDRAAVRELLGFGRWVFVSSFFTFLASQADRLIVGAATSVAKLGIYHIAAMFASVPTILVSTLANNLLIPYYSGLRRTSRKPLIAISRAHALAGILAWCLTSGLVLASQDVIGFLYRGPFTEAGPMLKVIAIVAWFQMLQALGGAILFASGKAQFGALVNFLKLVALVIFVPIGLRSGVFEGLLWAFALAEFTRYLVTLYSVRRLGVHLWLGDLVLTALLGLVFVASAYDVVGASAPTTWLTAFLSEHSAWMRERDRGLHIARLLVEAGVAVMASALVLATYWFGIRASGAGEQTKEVEEAASEVL